MITSRPLWPRFGLIDATLHTVAGLIVLFVLICMFSFSAYYKTDYFAHVSSYMDSLSTWADVLELFYPSSPLYMNLEGVNEEEMTEVTDNLEKISARIDPVNIFNDEDYESVKIFVVPLDDLIFKVEGFYNGLSINVNDVSFDEVSYNIPLSLKYKEFTANYTLQLLNKTKYQVDTTQLCKEGEKQCGNTCYGLSLDLVSPVVYWGENGQEEESFAVYEDKPLKSNIISHSLLKQTFDMNCETTKVLYKVNITKDSGVDTALSIAHSKSPYLDYDGEWGESHLPILNTGVAFFILFIIFFILFIVDVPIVKVATRKCKEKRYSHLKENVKSSCQENDETSSNIVSSRNSDK